MKNKKILQLASAAIVIIVLIITYFIYKGIFPMYKQDSFSELGFKVEAPRWSELIVEQYVVGVPDKERDVGTSVLVMQSDLIYANYLGQPLFGIQFVPYEFYIDRVKESGSWYDEFQEVEPLKLSLVDTAYAVPAPTVIKINNINQNKIDNKLFYNYAFLDSYGRRVDVFIVEAEDKKTHYKIQFYNQSKGFIKRIINSFDYHKITY